MYRRFTITAAESPVFTEGVIMPHSPQELERIGEETAEQADTFELKHTAIDNQEVLSTHIPLKAALDMGSSDAPKITTKRKRKSCLTQSSEQSPIQITDNWPRPPKKPLPPVPPSAFKGSEVRIARRQKTPSPSCSIFCDEEEAIFPTRKWAKPLSNMGDSLNWKLAVLNRFNAIQY